MTTQTEIDKIPPRFKAFWDDLTKNKLENFLYPMEIYFRNEATAIEFLQKKATNAMLDDATKKEKLFAELVKKHF